MSKSKPESRARQVLGLIDLTSLNEDDSDADIQKLCEHAITPHGQVAAVCVSPRFVGLAATLLHNTSSVKVATVINFPTGDMSIDSVLTETQFALQNGVDEIDLVLPYEAFSKGSLSLVIDMLRAVRKLCSDDITLKVILETGVLQSTNLISQATHLCIENGANFVKTSTGKTAVSATLPAVITMLESIKRSGKTNIGIKPSGGIKTLSQATEYLQIIEETMGRDWIGPEHVRLGASSLLQDVLKALEPAPKA